METRVQTLTQKSRAAGIHLVLATQYTSTDVISGVIKSNLPTRIAFCTATDVDSRIILDQAGAQNLLGKGDFIYITPGIPFPSRVQGAYVPPHEVSAVVSYIKNNCKVSYANAPNIYTCSTNPPEDHTKPDPIFIEALRVVVLNNSASISLIQRKCQLGYNRAGQIMEWMEDMGYISPFEGAKARTVLITKEEFEDKYGPL